MAVKTFDNQGGAGDGTWAGNGGANWDPVNVPIDNDTVVIAADCSVSTNYSGRTFEQLTVNSGKTLTIASGGDIRFDTNVSDFTGDLTIETGGIIYFTDILELETNGVVSLDGGTIVITEADSSPIRWEVRGTGIVSTANGGTIKLVCSVINLATLFFNDGALTGNSASRIIVDGDSGLAKGLVSLLGNQNVTNVDFDGVSKIDLPGVSTPISLDNCLFHNCDSVFPLDEDWLIISNSWIYSNTNGITVEDLSHIDLRNVVFGENEAAGSAENTGFDIELNSLTGQMHNCKLSSTTPISIGGSELTTVTMTSYDQDETDWREYQGRGHLAQPEFDGGPAGAGDTAVKCTASASAADNNGSRFLRLVAVIPATHGDVIDVTLYLKGTNLDTSKLHIDPDGVYGTTQVWNETADGSYNQRTIPSYTVSVSGGAGTKVSVPIYLDITGANEVWYYDTLDWTIS